MVRKKTIDALTSTDTKTKRWKMLFAAARMAYDSGEFRQAESAMARAAESAKELPEASFATSATDVGAAAIYLATKRPKEAKSRMDKAISNLKSYPDNMHRELLAVAMRFHAQALVELGDEREAEKEYKEAINILEDLGIDAAVQLSYALSDLCSLYLNQGRYSEAESYILLALKIASAILGPEHPDYIRTDMIYQLCMPMDWSARAETASDSIRKVEYQFGSKHPTVARALSRYIQRLEEKGEHEKIAETVAKFGIKEPARNN